MLRVDHFMYAVPDLQLGMQWAQDTFDCKPQAGGAHKGLGTCNALLSLGDTYLEIIAPDPEQTHENNLGAKFSALSQGGLVTWAAQSDLGLTATKLAKHNIDCLGPVKTEREDPQGAMLIWQLLFPKNHNFGPTLPFFIDWLACPHPSTTNPQGGEYCGLSITTPQFQRLDTVLQDLGLDIEVKQGEPTLSLNIACSKGDVVLRSSHETQDIRLA